MRRAQVEVFLLSLAIATAMATSYEQTGDCGVSEKYYKLYSYYIVSHFCRQHTRTCTSTTQKNSISAMKLMKHLRRLSSLEYTANQVKSSYPNVVHILAKFSVTCLYGNVFLLCEIYTVMIALYIASIATVKYSKNRCVTVCSWVSS